MPDALNLLVKPVGADCNLSCGYCFYRRAGELYDGAAGAMPIEVLEPLLRDFLGLGQAESALTWQGGEPTLAGLDFFRQAMTLERRLARPGQAVAHALQTNGTLIDEAWAGFLKEEHWLVGLSLDGPPEVHEVFRGPTHARAAAAAGLLQRRGVPVNALAVVSAASAGRAREIYAHLRGLGFEFLQFVPCVERDARGALRDCSIGPEAYGRFMCEIFDLWREEPAGAVSVRTFEALAAAALGLPRPLCTFGRRCADHLLVERNGDVYPCDFFARTEWRLGNLAQRPLPELAASAKRATFAEAKAVLPEECRACRWRELCRGGCLKDRPAFPAVPVGRTHLCEGYRMLFEHTGGYFARFAARRRAALVDQARPARPRPNAACPCGSGRKFKHCCRRRSGA